MHKIRNAVLLIAGILIFCSGLRAEDYEKRLPRKYSIYTLMRKLEIADLKYKIVRAASLVEDIDDALGVKEGETKVRIDEIPELKKIDKLKYDYKKFEQIVSPPRMKMKLKTIEEEGKIIELKQGMIRIAPEIPNMEETSLTIYGRKMVTIKFGSSMFLNVPDTFTSSEFFNKDNWKQEETKRQAPSGGLSSGLDIKQELQVTLQGKVGRKIDVNVRYDDTSNKQRNILVTYKGDTDEFVQEAEFGDINLYLPNTEFVAYNKSLFGVSVKAKLAENLSLKAIGSRTKGISEHREFKGNTQLQKRTLDDINFIRKKYFKLKDTNIDKYSEEIYIDDQVGSNNQQSDTSMIAYGEPPLDGDTNKYAGGAFDKQVSGMDYIIDYKKGIITFRKGISDNYVIALVYKRSDGTPVGYVDSNNNGNPDAGERKPVIIKDSKNSKDFFDAYETKNIYYLGDRDIVRDDKDFVFEIQDKNQKRVMDLSDPKKYNGKFNYIIDYELGYIEFDNAKPFSSVAGPDVVNDKCYENIYDSRNKLYTLYLEYKATISAIYMLQPFIVENSEVVYMDGKLLKRNEDYSIEYTSGIITFYNQDRITKDTKISVDYEYSPFGGAFQHNLLGLRAEWDPLRNLKLGSTFLYDGSTSSAEIPNVSSTPTAQTVWDIDFNFANTIPIARKIVNLLPYVSVPEPPLSLSFSGEYAWARNTQNTFDVVLENKRVKGVAMLDDMEGAKSSSSQPVGEDAWILASKPPAVPIGELRGKTYYHEMRKNSDGTLYFDNDGNYEDLGPKGYDVRTGPYNEPIGPKNKENTTIRQNSLVFDYDFSDSSTWVSVGRLVSKEGEKYNDFTYLDIVAKSEDGASVELRIDVGVIDENADNDQSMTKDSKPKSEDSNGDNLLNPGEDVGWKFVDGANVTRVGGGNGRLDSEDLDNDGKLTLENEQDIVTFPDKSWNYTSPGENTNANQIIVSGQEWKLYRLRLNLANLATEKQDLLKRVKMMRMWFKNNAGKARGKLYINSIEFVKNMWETKNLSDTHLIVLAYNTIDDSANYTPESLRELRPDYYFRIHPEVEYGNGNGFDAGTKVYKEQTLALSYKMDLSTDSVVWAKRIYNQQFDLSNYKEMRMFIRGKSGMDKGGKLFLRFGSDDNNYFEYRFDIKADWKDSWVLLTSQIPKIKDRSIMDWTGVPTLNNIKQLIVGIENNTGSDIQGELWVNEIHVAEIEDRDGQAYRLGSSLSLSDWFSLGGDLRRQDYKFETIGRGRSFQQTASESLGGRLSLIRAIMKLTPFEPYKTQDILPVNASISHGYSYTPVQEEANVTKLDRGENNSIGRSASTSFSMGSLLLSELLWEPLSILSPFSANAGYNDNTNNQINNRPLVLSKLDTTTNKTVYSDDTETTKTDRFSKNLSLGMGYNNSWNTPIGSIGGGANWTRTDGMDSSISSTEKSETKAGGISLMNNRNYNIVYNASYSPPLGFMSLTYGHTKQDQMSENKTWVLKYDANKNYLGDSFASTDAYDYYPYSKAYNAGLNLSGDVLGVPGVSPSINSAGSYNENYRKDRTPPFYVFNNYKDINTNGSIGANLNIAPERWWDPLRLISFGGNASLSINANYQRIPDTGQTSSYYDTDAGALRSIKAIWVQYYKINLQRMYKWDYTDTTAFTDTLAYPLADYLMSGSVRRSLALNSRFSPPWIFDFLTMSGSIGEANTEDQQKANISRTQQRTYTVGATAAFIKIFERIPLMNSWTFLNITYRGDYTYSITNRWGVTGTDTQTSEARTFANNLNLPWNISLNYTYSSNENYNMGKDNIVGSNSKNHSGSIRTNTRINLPDLLKVPFTDWIFKLTNTLDMGYALDVSYNNSENNITWDKQWNKTKDGTKGQKGEGKFSASVNYDIQQNINTSFGGAVLYHHDPTTVGQKYLAWQVDWTGTLLF